MSITTTLSDLFIFQHEFRLVLQVGLRLSTYRVCAQPKTDPTTSSGRVANLSSSAENHGSSLFQFGWMTIGFGQNRQSNIALNSSGDLAKSRRLWSKFGQISTNLVENWPDLEGSQQDVCEIQTNLVKILLDLCLRERGKTMNGEISEGRSVESNKIDFSCEDLPTNLQVSIPGSGDSLSVLSWTIFGQAQTV